MKILCNLDRQFRSASQLLDFPSNNTKHASFESLELGLYDVEKITVIYGAIRVQFLVECGLSIATYLLDNSRTKHILSHQPNSHKDG